VPELIIPTKAPDPDGKVLSITPESAGWGYVGFEVYTLKHGQRLKKKMKDQEACLVILSGKATITTKKEKWKNIGQRMSVFEEIPPYSVYVPSADHYDVEALTDLELAVCLAPGKGSVPARLIAPEVVGVEMQGAGNFERQIHNILPEQEPADSLLVAEVFTPEGHWSSYPPHKHDQHNPPHEYYLEEITYHKINPGYGFVVQRLYNDDRSLDKTLIVKNNDAVLVSEGYHPVSAPPGNEVYYLNVMAGPIRTSVFHNEPDHGRFTERKPAVRK
jgi:5-deoxy-glucuronate isomerase